MLAAQVATIGSTDGVVTTTNVGQHSRYVQAVLPSGHPRRVTAGHRPQWLRDRVQSRPHDDPVPYSTQLAGEGSIPLRGVAPRPAATPRRRPCPCRMTAPVGTLRWRAPSVPQPSPPADRQPRCPAAVPLWASVPPARLGVTRQGLPRRRCSHFYRRVQVLIEQQRRDPPRPARSPPRRAPPPRPAGDSVPTGYRWRSSPQPNSGRIIRW